MKALRYIDNTGVMRVQVVPDDYELTRDEQRRLGKDFWFEGLYEALGAKDEHDKARKGQPAEPWLKEFVTPGDRQVPTNLVFSNVQDPKDFGLAARYPEAVGGPGAPDDREEPGDEELIRDLADLQPDCQPHDARVLMLQAGERLEALRAERDARHSAMMTAREAANQFLARAEKAEAERDYWFGLAKRAHGDIVAEVVRLREAGVRFCDDFVSRFSEPLTDPERGMLRAAAELRAALAPVEAKVGNQCRAAKDGDCIWEDCPQKRDYRYICPLYADPVDDEI